MKYAVLASFSSIVVCFRFAIRSARMPDLERACGDKSGALGCQFFQLRSECWVCVWEVGWGRRGGEGWWGWGGGSTASRKLAAKQLTPFSRGLSVCTQHPPPPPPRYPPQSPTTPPPPRYPHQSPTTPPPPLPPQSPTTPPPFPVLHAVRTGFLFVCRHTGTTFYIYFFSRKLCQKERGCCLL